MALLAGALTLLSVAIGCAPSPVFVPGPETPNLIDKTKGIILINQRWDAAGGDTPRILAVSLPDGKKSIIRSSPDGVTTVSGPDRDGLIAFVQDTVLDTSWAPPNRRRWEDGRLAEFVDVGDTVYDTKWVRLKIMNIADRHETTIFDMPVSTKSYDDGYSRSLALSPVNKCVAMIRGPLKRIEMVNRDAYFMEGILEVWDVEQGVKKDIGDIRVLDDGGNDHSFSWFPDGRRLCYTALVSKEECLKNKIPILDEAFGDSFRKRMYWNYYPVVCIYDVSTGESSYFCLGFYPAVSVDGEYVVLRNFDKQFRRISTRDLSSERIDWPANMTIPPISALPGNMVIYAGYLTAGSPVHRIKYGSFSVGTPMVSLKLAEINTDRFQTILVPFDFRNIASFGLIQK